MKCAECRYYKESECRRYPPEAIVLPDDWCGEFSSAKADWGGVWVVVISALVALVVICAIHYKEAQESTAGSITIERSSPGVIIPMKDCANGQHLTYDNETHTLDCVWEQV